MEGRPRQESFVELDVEFIRPKYTLVFSLSAVFILIVLNISFWQMYVEVIIWAIAASQLIRPLTDDFVRAAKRLYDARMNTKRSVLILFYEVIVDKPNVLNASSPKNRSFSIKAKKRKDGGTATNAAKKKSVISSFVTFMFSNPTLFLIIALCYHLMPFYVFAFLFVAISLLIVVLAFVFDRTGVTETILRSATRPEVVSTVIIAGILIVLVAVDATIVVAMLLEVADLVSNLSSSFSELISTLSKDSKAAVVSSFPTERLAWFHENAVKVYDYSSREFGQKKWWVVVETLRGSFERGDPAEVMARSGLYQMRQIYNDTEWLGLVEMAVMAAVPEHRVSGGSKSVPLDQLFNTMSLRNIWLSFGETAWRFSALILDVIKLLSEFAGQVLVFIFILQTLCKASRDVITCVCIFTVPASSKDRVKLNDNLRAALRDAFTDPVTQAHKTALVVLIVYGLLGVPGAFLSCTFVYIASIFRVFPQVPSLLCCALPWLSYQAMRLYLGGIWTDHWLWFDLIRAVLLPVFLLELNGIANGLRRRNPEKSIVSPWLTDFSLAVGVTRFGMDGIILGPFLAAVTYVVMDFVIRIAEQDLTWDDRNIAEHSIKRLSELQAMRDATISLPANLRKLVDQQNDDDGEGDGGMPEAISILGEADVVGKETKAAEDCECTSVSSSTEGKQITNVRATTLKSQCESF